MYIEDLNPVVRVGALVTHVPVQEKEIRPETVFVATILIFPETVLGATI